MSDVISFEPRRRFPAHLTDYRNDDPSRHQSLKAIKRRCRDLIAQGTPYAAMRLMEAANGDDDRVAVVAASQLLDHARKIDDRTDDGGGGTLDEAQLTPEELAHAYECAEHLHRYINVSQQRRAAHGGGDE